MKSEVDPITSADDEILEFFWHKETVRGIVTPGSSDADTEVCLTGEPQQESLFILLQ